MSRLGELTISGGRAAVEAREKVRRLALGLGFDGVSAARIATGSSEALSWLGDASLAARVEGALALTVRGAAPAPHGAPPQALRLLFDRVGIAPDGALELVARLPLSAQPPSGPALEALRRAFEAPSRRELMERLRVKNLELEDQQERLAEAAAEAERANAAKSEFLASMSHELRTPLNSVIGFTRRLLKRLDGAISARDLDALVTVDRNARHLLALISDLLDLSKIEAGKVELERSATDLGALVRAVLAETEPLLEAKGHRFAPELPDRPLTLEVDPQKLRQVLTNLISNAVKYSDGGRIGIALRSRPDSAGGGAAIAVRDEGAGIPADQLERLFQRFSRLETEATRRAGGTGLGLAISAQYVALHGGQIEVESVVGEGTVFRVVLPAERPRPGDPQPGEGQG